MLITASFDHYVVTWDFGAMEKKIEEVQMMRAEDVQSRRMEVNLRTLDEKKRGTKVKAIGGGGGGGKKKKKK